MFPAINGKSKTMAGSEVQVEEPEMSQVCDWKGNGQKKINWKNVE